MTIDLTKIKDGEGGVIKELAGGHDFLSKVQGMGMRPGKRIKKISSHFWRGPQTVQVDNASFAIGWGMAKKIFIEVKR